MRNIMFGSVIIAAFPLAGCDQVATSTLICDVSYLSDSSDDDGKIERRLNAKLYHETYAGGRNFKGKLTAEISGAEPSYVEGFYAHHEDGSFSLVIEAGAKEIVVLPQNEILQKRGLQGVVLEDGGHVDTSAPLTASCNTVSAEH